MRELAAADWAGLGGSGWPRLLHALTLRLLLPRRLVPLQLLVIRKVVVEHFVRQRPLIVLFSAAPTSSAQDAACGADDARGAKQCQGGRCRSPGSLDPQLVLRRDGDGAERSGRVTHVARERLE